MKTAIGKRVDLLCARLSGLLAGWTISWITVFLGVLVAVAQFAAGVRLGGPGAAHDGAFAVWSFIQFRADLAFDSFPRWSPAGFNGLGSPVFLFYPPGAFYAAALTGLLAPALAAADVIAVTGILFRILAVFTCFAWLRRRTSATQALFGGGLYALMSWISIFDPQVRLAFAETAGAAILPLAFLAADLGKGRPRWLFLGTALTTCLLTLMHVPTVVANSGVLLTYIVLSEASVGAAIRSALAAVAGLGFGLASAGYKLLPALVLLPSIMSSALWDAEHQPEGNFFLTPASLRTQLGMLSDICLLAPVSLAAIVGAKGLRAGRIPIGLVASLGVACFFLLPVSFLFWEHLLPLRMVQFPGRFMPSVALLASAVIALSLAECRAGMQLFGIGVTWAMGLGALVFAIHYGDGASPGLKRTEDAIIHWRANAPEYVPQPAASKGWFTLMPNPEAFARQLGEMTSPCLPGASESGRATDRRETFDVSRCSGSVVLPVFFFPGWTAKSDDGQQLAVRADDGSGLVIVGLPPQAERITLRRSPTRIETVGSLASLVSISILAAFAVGLLGRNHARRV